jgi:phosphatidylserine decarboxylase
MIQYVDRESGQVCEERVYGGKSLVLLYGNGLFSTILYYLVLPLLARIPFFSRLYGWLQKKPGSRKKIEPFIKTYGIDKNEFATTKFDSFNDFFTRKLKPACRPVVQGAHQIAMPADGRYLAYPTFDRFFVKGQEFDLKAFLQDPVLAHRFREGSMVIARLCPVDYHRFHFPCSGTASKPHLINGPLYSVNPIALKRWVQILSENKRVITEIETDSAGTVLYVEIGATAVGTIQQTFNPNSRVEKGQEKGYFEFGGSCLVLLFEKNRIRLDDDLVQNTKNGKETLCRFGSSLGIAL